MTLDELERLDREVLLAMHARFLLQARSALEHAAMETQHRDGWRYDWGADAGHNLELAIKVEQALARLAEVQP
jgi:hypothetical protein